MKFRLIVSAEAERDAEVIYAWLAKHSPQGAVAWYEAYCDAVDALKESLSGIQLPWKATCFAVQCDSSSFRHVRAKDIAFFFL